MSRTFSRFFVAGLHPSLVSQYLHVHFCAGIVWMSSQGLYVLKIDFRKKKNVLQLNTVVCSVLLLCLRLILHFGNLLTHKNIPTDLHLLNYLKLIFVLKFLSIGFTKEACGAFTATNSNIVFESTTSFD